MITNKGQAVINKWVKYIGFVSILAGIILLVYMASQPKHAEWTMISGLGGKCLDVEGSRVLEGTRVIGYDCHGNFNQRFDVTYGGGPIKIAGLCLDPAAGSNKNGTNLILWPCHGGLNQEWRYDNQNNRFVNFENKCLDLEGGQLGWSSIQSVVLWDCNQLPNQKWFFARTFMKERIVGQFKEVSPGKLDEIKPVKGVYAGANGFLNNEQGEKIALSNRTPILVKPSTTLIPLIYNDYLVPANSVEGGVD